MDAPATAVRVCGRKGQRGWGKHACQQQYQQESGRQTMHVLRNVPIIGRIGHSMKIIQARSSRLWLMERQISLEDESSAIGEKDYEIHHD
jgi:hypothetical protein